MPGRFPLYTDADIHGPLVEALVQEGWDVLRAIDRFPEGTNDYVHFDEAVRLGRVRNGRVVFADELFTGRDLRSIRPVSS